MLPPIISEFFAAAGSGGTSAIKDLRITINMHDNSTLNLLKSWIQPWVGCARLLFLAKLNEKWVQ